MKVPALVHILALRCEGKGDFLLKNLKLLYFLTLCALCLYVAIGPAQAGTVVIRNLGVQALGPAQGSVSWLSGPGWAIPGFGPAVSLGMEAQCVSEVTCVDTVDFSFIVDDGGQGETPITISLSGTSTDHNATGTVAFYDLEPGGETIQNWISPEGFLLMTPFTVETPGIIEGRYSGEFTFSLAPQGVLNVPLAGSLDFNSAALPASDTPEPGSALLLGVGIVCVGFLRRKVHG
jgi:hypothetical protein